MRTVEFDFHLPADRIAREPLPERDASRLMVLGPSGPPAHRAFLDLPELLAPGDLLVLNDTRVIPARLRGTREPTGGKVDVLLVEPLPARGDRAVWRCLAQASKPLRPGSRLRLGTLAAEIIEPGEDGLYALAFEATPDELMAAVEAEGEVPLPPYLERAPAEADRDRYQTVYARVPGAVAAPTAGLHFTDRVFAKLAERGIATARLTLHVGPGTFLPVRGEDVSAHRMHEERFEIPESTAAAVAAARRVIAVGTTSLRALEAAAGPDGTVRAGSSATDIFITPGYTFRAVGGLVTNFHLPRSTLVMLVSALAGRERLLAAYDEAVERSYRFYSYGDAMLVLP